MDKLKLYFSCALTGLPPEHREAMVVIRENLKEYFDVLEFCSADTPVKKIYEHDIHNCVKTADLLVSLCDNPSLGLGYEMGVAVEVYRKPVLALAQTDSNVSGLIRGITQENFELQRYEHTKEILPLLLDFAKRKFPGRV
ncbi:MAG: hypothetical protein JWL80_642 [Parcubacteria group bacterium]|nr:hypothetical protein [Parcubacteria group bacterium]